MWRSRPKACLRPGAVGLEGGDARTAGRRPAKPSRSDVRRRTFRIVRPRSSPGTDETGEAGSVERTRSRARPATGRDARVLLFSHQRFDARRAVIFAIIDTEK